MVATSPVELSSRARWERRLEREIDHGKRGVWCIGSQRVQGARERGRGRPVAPESTARIHGDRRGEWRYWRRPGASGTMWLGEEEEGNEAELSDAPGEQGGGCGRTSAGRQRRFRSVELEGESQGRGERAASEGEGTGASGNLRGVARRGRGSRRWPEQGGGGARVASTRPRPSGERREMTGTGQLGWAVLGQAR